MTSAFIIDIQSELQPDYEQMNNTLLELLLNATVGNIPPGQALSLPRWTGPDPAIRQVQATLYATLCATLFAAFLATLGKQWISQYRQTDARGSLEDRCKDRERKLNGIDRWKFHLVMQFAPLTIQGSLALLGSALSQYLWGVDRTVSSVVIGFTSLGCIIYIAIVTTSILSFDCPFQTPISTFIHFTIKTVKPWLQKLYRRVTPNHASLAEGGLNVGTAFLPLQSQVYYLSLSPYWEKGYRHDARCITRMLVMSTDVATIRFTMGFIQDFVWDAGIKSAPLEQIYRKLISCFDWTHPHTPILIPTLQDIAYLSAKAFAHIQVQQHCIPLRRGSGHVGENWRADTRHTPLGSPGSCGDPNLESALLMVDKAFGSKVEIPWNTYRLTPAHRLWVSHLLVYHAWCDPLQVPDDVLVFVKHTLDPDDPPDLAVIANCLYIIDVLLGTSSRVEDFARRDKRFYHLASSMTPVLILAKPPDRYPG